MTSKMKIEKQQLYVYQMKTSNPGNIKIAMEYSIIDLLVASNDLKNENCKTTSLCISNESQ